MLGGVGSVALLLHMNGLNKTESAIFVSLVCSLLPEDFHSEIILSSLQIVLCRVETVQRHGYFQILRITLDAPTHCITFSGYFQIL